MTPNPPQFWRPDMEEATPMYLILLGAMAALVLTGAAWWRIHQLRHLIRVERAETRLLRGVDRRDLDAFEARVRAAELVDQVVADADRIVTAELARTPHYPHHPHEGDPT